MNSLAQTRDTAAEALDKYTSPSGAYPFRTYDARPINTGAQLLPEDVLAANLLNLRLGAGDVIPLFAEGDGAPQQLLIAMNEALNDLRERPAFETYRSTAELDRALSSLKRANEVAEAVLGWTSVRVSKVLHRHVPHLVPIVDSRVLNFYGCRETHVGELYHRLWEDIRANAEWLYDLASDYRAPDGRELSLLRVADILIRMQSPDSTAPTVDELAPQSWDRDGLTERSWEGFVPLVMLKGSDVPDAPGVYVVLREDDNPPEFLPQMPHIDPEQVKSYPVPELQTRWVKGAHVLYIGKAGTSLRKRLRQYSQFGNGTGLNHKGGKSIWQLADADRLTVAWRAFPASHEGINVGFAESALIARFREAFGGKRPFANLVD